MAHSDRASGSPETRGSPKHDNGAAGGPSIGDMDIEDIEWTFPDSKAVSMSAAYLSAIHLSLRDGAIMCACPAGTPRKATDIAKIQTGDTFTWIHVPCKPLLVQVSEASAAMANMILERAADSTRDGDDMQALAEKSLASSLGPNATEQQLRKVRNLTSTFRCDGPCRGSTDCDEYFWCQECYAWQHKPCMLFGDGGDLGRPVCNVCYVNAIIHQEEIERWQKKRLAQAGLEALWFIRDPENEGNKEGLAFARNFLERLVSKNRNNFFQFILNRRRVIRWVKARRGLEQPTYGAAARLPAIEGSADELYDPAAQYTAPRKRTRRSRARKESDVAGSDDGLDSMRLGDDEYSEFEDPDTTIAGGAKAAPKKKAPRKAKPRPRAFEPLVSELTEEDKARNEVMRLAAERKARKKAAAATAAAATIGLAVEDETEAPPAKRARIERRVTLFQQSRENAGDGAFSDLGILPNQQKRDVVQASKQTSRGPRKSALSSGWTAADRGLGEEETEVESDHASNKRSKGRGEQRQFIANDIPDEGEQSAPRRARSRAHRRSTTATNDDEEDRPPRMQQQQKQGESSRDGRQHERPKIMCSCIDVTRTDNCFKCLRCDLYQHITCASSQSMSDTLCKLCVGSGVASASSMLPPYAPVRPPTVAPAQPHASSKFRAPSLAGPSTTQIEAKHEPLSQAMHDEVRTLCSTILWSAYCELPDPNDPDDYMRLNRVKSPPPSNWLAEAEKRVTIMFEAAGQEKISEYLRHEFSAWPRNNVNIMKALRDFAMWMRITGPFRRARRELGLLNEILGFDEKGRYWQSD